MKRIFLTIYITALAMLASGQTIIGEKGKFDTLTTVDETGVLVLDADTAKVLNMNDAAQAYIMMIDAAGHVTRYDTTGLWTAGGQWARNGNYVYLNYTTDSAGIGLTSPEHDLDVNGWIQARAGLELGRNLGTSGRINFTSATADEGSMYITNDDYLTLAGFVRLVHTGDFYLTGDLEQTGAFNLTGAIDASGTLRGSYVYAESGGFYFTDNWPVHGDGITVVGNDMSFHINSSVTPVATLDNDGDFWINGDLTVGNWAWLQDSLRLGAALRSGAYFLVMDGSGQWVTLMDTTGWGGGGGGSSLWQDDGGGQISPVSATSITVDTANIDVLVFNKGGTGSYDFNVQGQFWADTSHLYTLFFNADTLDVLPDFLMGLDSSGGLVELVPLDSITASIESLWQDAGQGRAELASLTSVAFDTAWSQTTNRELYRNTSGSGGHFGYGLVTANFGYSTVYMSTNAALSEISMEANLVDVRDNLNVGDTADADVFNVPTGSAYGYHINNQNILYQNIGRTVVDFGGGTIVRIGGSQDNYEIFDATNDHAWKAGNYVFMEYDQSDADLFLNTGVSFGIETTAPNTSLDVQGGQTWNVTTVNAATYDLIVTDHIVHVTYTTTGAVTSLTLPTAQAVEGRMVIIKDAGGNAATNNITIDTGGSETIDGSSTLVINGDYDCAEIYSDGTNWFIKNIY